MSKQVNQYSVYVRYAPGTQPVEIAVEASTMPEAQSELRKWISSQLPTHRYLYATSKLRRAYKMSNANIFHPTDSTLTIVNKK